MRVGKKGTTVTNFTHVYTSGTLPDSNMELSTGNMGFFKKPEFL